MDEEMIQWIVLGTLATMFAFAIILISLNIIG